MGFVEKLLKVFHRSVVGINAAIIFHVITVIAWGRIDWHEPDPLNAKVIIRIGVAVI
ncbi:hypothetical protein D3C76_1810870 [compost metagenome]